MSELGILVAVACCEKCHTSYDAIQLASLEPVSRQEFLREAHSRDPQQWEEGCTFQCQCGALVWGDPTQVVLLPPHAFAQAYPDSDRVRTRVVRLRPTWWSILLVGLGGAFLTGLILWALGVPWGVFPVMSGGVMGSLAAALWKEWAPPRLEGR